MTQTKQVIKVMEKLGGVATLRELNQKVEVSDWRAKDPYASIRRIVQNEKYFFKIKPGLWGLNAYRQKLEKFIGTHQTEEKQEALNHYYYQGLLLEIGNIKDYKTFVPAQDKNKQFLRTTLGELRNLQDLPPFSYRETVNRVRMIDVIWFNRRKMPYAAFEVEHSTDFTNALSKYIALQDFNTKFHVVAHQNKRQQFNEKICRDEYRPIKERVKFIDYEKLGDWHGQNIRENRFEDMP